jgi:glycine/D-amino acid oxidase-like deaminating enzyme
MGSHNDTPPGDPEAGLAAVSPAETAAFHAGFVAGHAEGVTPRRLRAVPCFYTMTPDGHFIVDDHPALPGVTVLAACSGHGFKHSAALGEAVAARLAQAGPAHVDLAPFALARFG